MSEVSRISSRRTFPSVTNRCVTPGLTRHRASSSRSRLPIFFGSVLTLIKLHSVAHVVGAFLPSFELFRSMVLLLLGVFACVGLCQDLRPRSTLGAVYSSRCCFSRYIVSLFKSSFHGSRVYMRFAAIVICTLRLAGVSVVALPCLYTSKPHRRTRGRISSHVFIPRLKTVTVHPRRQNQIMLAR